jgi:hypothetical protein
MTRSQWAFIRGACGAVLRASMPSAAKTASKDPVYLAVGWQFSVRAVTSADSLVAGWLSWWFARWRS